MFKKDIRDINRRLYKEQKRHRLIDNTFSIFFLWLRGVIVIVEILAILTGLYFFNGFFFSLSVKNQMRIVWAFVFGFLIFILPLILGAMAGISANASKMVRKVISVPNRKRTF